MKCSEDFPHEKVKSVRPAAPPLEPAGPDVEYATAFEAFALQKDIFSVFLEYLPHTTRASLSQVSVTIARAISDCHYSWTVDGWQLMDAEYTEEEFKRLCEAGQNDLGIQDVRGARVSSCLPSCIY